MEELHLCCYCGKSKVADDFYASCMGDNGWSPHCKACNILATQESRKTKVGLITKMYNTQRASSKKRGHYFPYYSREWFIGWLITMPKFGRLYKEWRLNGYPKELVPSVDRIDDALGYMIGNIQLMTFRENQQKEYDRTKKGDSIKKKIVYRHPCGKLVKPKAPEGKSL